MKGNSRGEGSNFLAISVVPFQEFSWKCRLCTHHQENNDVWSPSINNGHFTWTESTYSAVTVVPENPGLSLCAHYLQYKEVWLRLINNERYLENKVVLRVNLSFNSRDFPDVADLTFCEYILENTHIRYPSVKNEGNFAWRTKNHCLQHV